MPSPSAAPPSGHASAPGLRWDVFCQVIDNYGDMGVCWRLAADLASRGHAVRLWTNDAGALAWMAPWGTPGVQVLPWPAAAPADGPGDVVVEAFGCEIPGAFVASMAQPGPGRARPPVWINLEYLSAEGYVERCHGLPSPVLHGPGTGLTRWFFYPGFTPRTGGLLREPALAARQARFDRAAWRAGRGIAADALAVSLFCYEPPALAQLLQRLAAVSGGAHLLVTPGRAAAALRALQGPGGAPAAAAPGAHRGVLVAWLPACPQPAFDELLWACDLNFVRGEDSLVRALWAGQPFVWHIYPQDDGAHRAKLLAFLDWLQAPASWRQAHLAWNGMAPAASLPPLGPAELRQWHACALRARDRLLAQADLLTQLLGFVDGKS
ncbi:elongation factor P maturation arginine rhamnosyltransferase EarP [Melaminivora alkalimesophila]|uniref:Protein-arginine rhamnosyltransferase n=1 Tax=Melaminivora alkalimesophila TaxID=1165852 RepID=A0A317RGY2_9BURK|nr:elongation factor P maturation arginine rhamnosyltransferase EarP [Melaminivora alkalimesophila]PWW49011.1 putative repeat protein (TIGR03837 family) [Melaminivora alkalimesophila]